MRVSDNDIKDEIKRGIHKAARYGKHVEGVIGDKNKQASYIALVTDMRMAEVRRELDKPVFGCTTLLKDGVWMVPPERRPKGWEKLRLYEQGK